MPAENAAAPDARPEVEAALARAAPVRVGAFAWRCRDVLGAGTDSAGGATNERSPGTSSASEASPGRSLLVRGVMPARRVRARTLATWSSVIKVITVPFAPARAVRPERCR